MNQTNPKRFRAPRMLWALAAAFSLIPQTRAQEAWQPAGDRWLFVFETSSDMKPRLSAMQTEINDLLATSLAGHLHEGDSIGAWTFDRNLRTGQFPLSRWAPEDAKAVAARLNKFARGQRYVKGASFEALQQPLSQVVRDSTRLTVVIFCDGETNIIGTPYDNNINQVFQQRWADQKKARQPFILVLRTQLGRYVGCTLNFPPGMLSLPDFPPFPPPPPPPAPTNTPPPRPPRPVAPPRVGLPLIIVGTKVLTNWPPPPELLSTNAAPVKKTNAVPVRATNAPPPPTKTPPVAPVKTSPPPPAVMPAPTNPPSPANANAPANPVATTNAAVPPEKSGPEHKTALALGAALLVAAAALVALAFFRARNSNRGSLISRSMKKR